MKKSSRTFRATYLVFFCALVIAALLIQFVYGLFVSTSSSISYIALFITYFTIVSNVFVAYVLGAEAYASLHGHALSKRFDRIRGAAVFCIFTTGIIYSLFLKGPGGAGAVQNSIPWINSVFHYIMPTFMMLDWAIFPARSKIPWYSILSWMGLTVLYLIYVEIIGFFTNTYPYFFLNPVMFHGYLGVLKASITFIPFFAVFGAIVVGINRLRLTKLCK